MRTPRIEVLNANVAVLYLTNYTVLYSDNTPVACMNVAGKKYFRTSEFHSESTSKHIDEWLNGREADEMDQEFFENLGER